MQYTVAMRSHRSNQFIFLQLAIFLALSAPTYGSAECETITQLRSMGSTEFRSQRGKPALSDKEKYDTEYRMDGSKECTIHAKDGVYAELRCEWFLTRGIDQQAAAKAIFDETVKGLQACLPEFHRRTHYDKKGESVDFEVQNPGSKSKWIHSLSATYLWYPPWWSLSMIYTVAAE